MKMTKRRPFLTLLGLGGLGMATAQAQHTDTHFDERSAHRLVYL